MTNLQRPKRPIGLFISEIKSKGSKKTTNTGTNQFYANKVLKQKLLKIFAEPTVYDSALFERNFGLLIFAFLFETSLVRN